MGKFNLRRIVLDVVKPAVESSLISIAEAIAGTQGVESVNITVKEVDSKTEGLLVTVEGQEMDFELSKEITNCGAVIHSVDQIAGEEPTLPHTWNNECDSDSAWYCHRHSRLGQPTFDVSSCCSRGSVLSAI